MPGVDDSNEVSTIEDLHVKQFVDLGPDDAPPSDLSDDESLLDDDASSMASDAMDAELDA